MVSCNFLFGKRFVPTKSPFKCSHFVFFSHARRKVLRIAKNTAKKARFLPEFYALRRRKTPRRFPSKMTRNFVTPMLKSLGQAFLKACGGQGQSPSSPPINHQFTYLKSFPKHARRRAYRPRRRKGYHPRSPRPRRTDKAPKVPTPRPFRRAKCGRGRCFSFPRRT